MIEIRPEIEADWDSIYTITESAFFGKPYADGDEQDLIEKLRKIGVLSLSLVAADEGEIIGQITFSPATLSGISSPWFALGPVSVVPNRQGQGVGSTLIEEGLSKIRSLGALGCILTGNPVYYRRFGFELAALNCPDNEPKEYFMLKMLREKHPEGKFAFHEAFYDNE
jgi:putative acetyltransferase